MDTNRAPSNFEVSLFFFLDSDVIQNQCSRDEDKTLIWDVQREDEIDPPTHTGTNSRNLVNLRD